MTYLFSIAAVLAFLTSCKNFSTDGAKDFSAQGKSNSEIPPDRKQIIRSDKKKQADLDLPFRGFDYEKKITKIAIGSCADQELPQPIWATIDRNNPDLFIFAGDTVCSAKNIQKPLSQQYRKLKMISEFRNLREKTPMLAIWNDYDFGMDDGGAENPDKESHRTEFIKNWSYLTTALPRDQKALYHSKIFGPKKNKVQIIMLDTRWDRSALKKNPTPIEPVEMTALTPETAKEIPKDMSAKPVDVKIADATVLPTVETVLKPYLPDEDKSKHFLSEAQWNWLENELRKPADIRFIVSTIQVVANDHNFEKWGNFPLERERLFRLLGKEKVKNTILLSGDRQFSAISRIEVKKFGSLYELTAGGLNKTTAVKVPEENNLYVNEIYSQPNFGFIKINWETRKVQLEVHAADDSIKNSAAVSF